MHHLNLNIYSDEILLLLIPALKIYICLGKKKKSEFNNEYFSKYPT